jgi:UDP-N-acetylmuramoyl-L-alanyl-D-glutamate--2,6-diaminopimelate ligase
MQLSTIIQNTDCQLISGDFNVNIQNIQFDSRKVNENSLFVAIKGTTTDGHQYIQKAIDLGCKVVVLEDLPKDFLPDITYLQSQNTAKVLGLLASNFYGNPSDKIKIIAITGTNGKTTVSTLLYKLFRELGYKVGLLSTVQNQINDEIYSTQLTTPDALSIQYLLAEMVKKGCHFCFMEASSHALVQERLSGLKLAGGVFLNITHDHLDFHKTMENYIKAKKILFDILPKNAFALVNIDDKRGRVMLQNCPAKNQKTFSLLNIADFKGKILENTLQGLWLEINQHNAWFRLIGEFNAYNLVTVFGVASLLGEDENNIIMALSGLKGASGRFEQQRGKNGITAIVDYAHTPDALKNVLMTIEELKTDPAKVFTIVGCGGDRDTSKRPIMTKIACEFSDYVILTSDNPRSEDPFEILEQMQVGISLEQKKKIKVIENRKEAIAFACQEAQKEDIILVAGKGHETYQEIKGIKYPFDDREVLKEFLK